VTSSVHFDGASLAPSAPSAAAQPRRAFKRSVTQSVKRLVGYGSAVAQSHLAKLKDSAGVKRAGRKRWAAELRKPTLPGTHEELKEHADLLSDAMGHFMQFAKLHEVAMPRYKVLRGLMMGTALEGEQGGGQQEAMREIQQAIKLAKGLNLHVEVAIAMREYGWLCKDRGVVHLNEARYSLKEANELASKTEAEGLIQIQEIQSMLLSLPEEPRGQAELKRQNTVARKFSAMGLSFASMKAPGKDTTLHPKMRKPPSGGLDLVSSKAKRITRTSRVSL